MTRKCNCSGACFPQSDDLTRRDFISLVSAGTAGALLTSEGWPAWLNEQTPLELDEWKRQLYKASPPRLYRSDVHTDARMHLGGIGTGNIEIGADGQFTTWQLFNTLKDGSVPLYFGVKAGQTVKLLQTAGGPDWPRIQQVELTGEYPFAFLRFKDHELPVQMELAAFTPFAPLDTQFSSMPLAVLVFKLHNASTVAHTVSLAAFMQNPVGYEAVGKINGQAHPNFGGNLNEPFQENGATGLVFRAEAGKEPALDRPVSIYASPNLRGLKSTAAQYPPNLTIEWIDRLPSADPLSDPAHTLIWLEEPAADISEPILRAARAAVQAGASLVFSGKSSPLLQNFAQATGGKPLAQSDPRPDILFEDFEKGYDPWRVEGAAFGNQPARGTLPNQQRVSGFRGRGLVNTFLQGDDTTGKLISQSFKIERNLIRFLIGGGNHPTTQIRLVIDGKVVRAAAGRNNEMLLPASWDVREYLGQSARLEIVDEQQGPWGHINIDQIEFTDLPGNPAVMALLEELLPARFSGLQARAPSLQQNPETVQFENLALKAEAHETKARNGLILYRQPLGKGQVVVAAGAILDPAAAELHGARQSACAVVCELVGANYLAPSGTLGSAPGFGSLAMATVSESATVLPAFEDWGEAWKVFAAQSRFEMFPEAKANPPTAAGRTVNGALAATINLPAGATVEVPFILAWHYPNKYNASGALMGCHYATRWPDARTVLRETTTRLADLRSRTERFRRAFYDSTLPYWLLDCLTSQAAILRHIGVVFRLANGDVFGWEGSNGCCQPTCTHVWGYEQTLARLFPDLERAMRRIDFKHQQRPDGGINNRTNVPSPPRPTGERPFADGHASCVLKAWREALNQPDEAWLKEYWPGVKKAVDYLIARDAATAGGQPMGILQDDQWNTYDEALHGVTTFISAYYLAALRAGEAWARRLGDHETADRYQAVFEKGREKLNELCWNGEYFQQNLPDYLKRAGEVGPGCMSDQLIGQWWAHQLGLGYLLPKDKVQSALRAVFKYNWVPDLTHWKHSPRAFAGAKDKGLLICTWPKGGRPARVMLYSDEVWTGIEYQVAAHMIYEGMVEEGLAIIKGARDRYDGVPRPPIPRNPWNEIECGGHYARAMSSWSILLALSGYEYDGPAQKLSFTPRHTPEDFKAFFCASEGWGTLRQSRQGPTQRNEVSLVEGRLPIGQMVLAPGGTPSKVQASLNGQQLAVSFQAAPQGLLLTFKPPVVLKASETVTINVT